MRVRAIFQLKNIVKISQEQLPCTKFTAFINEYVARDMYIYNITEVL